jgi:hypothetical protein
LALFPLRLVYVLYELVSFFFFFFFVVVVLESFPDELGFGIVCDFVYGSGFCEVEAFG